MKAADENEQRLVSETMLEQVAGDEPKNGSAERSPKTHKARDGPNCGKRKYVCRHGHHQA